MTDAYFALTNDGFAPEPRAHGPWAEDMMHGRLLGGLAARELESEFGGVGWRASRLTVDLFRPAAIDTVTIATSPVRQGRKVRVADALISCGGHDVGRVTAVFLVTADQPPGKIWQPDHGAWPDPETIESQDDLTGANEVDGWLFRTVAGGMGSGEQSRIWTNDTVALVDGEAMSPLARAAVSGDIACPLANAGTDGLHYINADYTMMLARYPEGAWVGIEVTEQVQANGIAIASSTLRDQYGPFATSGGTSLVRPPLDMTHD